ncbi:hypothetical protein QTO34_007375 [Cnephaeus nilssonii]|uniref:Glutathione peroxidase n=1 Tax=Cnephaeus nilssonii TaxID=3371016 RepID=A0AA40HK39_CNENI|nr:hypothetical protein QTO34_007375 [Eptesicus nilssonii]
MEGLGARSSARCCQLQPPTGALEACALAPGRITGRSSARPCGPGPDPTCPQLRRVGAVSASGQVAPSRRAGHQPREAGWGGAEGAELRVPRDAMACLLKGDAPRVPLCSRPQRTLLCPPHAMCAAPLLAAAQAAAAPRSVHAFSARPLAGGEPVSLGSLRGKVLLIENVASL